MQATMTSKGQVTVPKAIRDKLCLRPGDRIDFLLDDNGARITPVKPSVKELKGMLPKPSSPVSLAEMDDAIAKASQRKQ